MTVLEKVKYLKERGITISYIARELNCSPQTLTQWIKGDRNISARLEKDLSAFLNDYVEEIYFIKGE